MPCDSMRIPSCSRSASSRPLDRAVENPLRRQVLLVRERMTVVEIADGNEQHSRVAVLAQHAGSVVEVVVIAVVERDQHRAFRQ